MPSRPGHCNFVVLPHSGPGKVHLNELRTGLDWVEMHLFRWTRLGSMMCSEPCGGQRSSVCVQRTLSDRRLVTHRTCPNALSVILAFLYKFTPSSRNTYTYMPSIYEIRVAVKMAAQYLQSRFTALSVNVHRM